MFTKESEGAGGERQQACRVAEADRHVIAGGLRTLLRFKSKWLYKSMRYMYTVSEPGAHFIDFLNRLFISHHPLAGDLDIIVS